MCRASLKVVCYEQPFTLVVEPWAEQYAIRVGDRCEIVACHPTAVPTFTAELYGAALVVWVNDGGSTYEFWRNGQVEFSTPIPTPHLPS